MPETLELTDLERLLERMVRLEEAAFKLLAAVEANDPDEIGRAKRKLGLVLADV